MRIKKVKFLVDKEPSGNLAMRRYHARRVTPYPAQMQALIDADLLTASVYEETGVRRETEQEARDDEVTRLLKEDKPHVLREIWNRITRALGCA